MRFEWEEIKNLSGCQTYRAKVFGGWIVNNLTQVKKHPNCNEPFLITESSVFVPDHEYKWEITE